MGKTISDFENAGIVFLMQRKLGSEGDYVRSPSKELKITAKFPA